MLASVQARNRWLRVPLSLLRTASQRIAALDGRLLLVVGPFIALVLALWMTAPDWGPSRRAAWTP